MSVIIRLQNLAWSANSLDIRQLFSGLLIPDGGVHIVGGEHGDAFIAFSNDEDARVAMTKTGTSLHGAPVTLLLSSRSEMQRVIDSARQQAVAPAPAAPITARAPVLAPVQAPAAPAVVSRPVVVQPPPQTVPTNGEPEIIEISRKSGTRDDPVGRRPRRRSSRSRSRSLDRHRDRDRRGRRQRSRSRDRRDRSRRDRSRDRPTRRRDTPERRSSRDHRRRSTEQTPLREKLQQLAGHAPRAAGLLGDKPALSESPSDDDKRVVLTDLPAVATYRDVRDFLRGLHVGTIKMERDGRCHRAVVVLASRAHRDEALQRSGRMVRGLRVHVARAGDEQHQLQQAQRFEEPVSELPASRPLMQLDEMAPRHGQAGNGDCGPADWSAVEDPWREEPGMEGALPADTDGYDEQAEHYDYGAPYHDAPMHAVDHEQAFHPMEAPMFRGGPRGGGPPGRFGPGFVTAGRAPGRGGPLQSRGGPLPPRGGAVGFSRGGCMPARGMERGGRFGPRVRGRGRGWGGDEMAPHMAQAPHGEANGRLNVAFVRVDSLSFFIRPEAFNQLLAPFPYQEFIIEHVPAVPDRRTGTAFVVFNSSEIAEAAIAQLSGLTRERRKLQLTRCSHQQFMQCLHSQQVPPYKSALFPRPGDQLAHGPEDGMGQLEPGPFGGDDVEALNNGVHASENGEDLTCVHMTGLPNNVTKDAVLQFFATVGLRPSLVHVRPGEAFCEWGGNLELVRAACVCTGRQTQVMEQTCTVMVRAVSEACLPSVDPRGAKLGLSEPPLMAEDPRPALLQTPVPGPEAFGRPGCVVAVANVPPFANTDDLLAFFGKYKLTPDQVMRRYDNAGRPTGDARIALNSVSEAQDAVATLHREPLAERPLYVTAL